ncbi:alpha/beta fold hydrolase [Mucilaginibacter sp. BT774]|uniref:alpha/beta fold hydrolase n=1 Tax=Mucilaginibacter sp. BT774 TaxID=3062276 RepID=UPI002676C68A|nr:alpha/beta hydrolase [Mucilaginibacter sp. BT774]MDO3625357.1 alpha/beta hydrolase [Mucilaginibacter sp. BT774]
MGKIFLISGLGADARIFQYIDLLGHEVIPIGWLEPEKQDSLSTYAQKLIDHYKITPGSIVIGNSLGGMLTVEIAKRVKLDKAILISSIKTASEAPRSHLLYRYLPLYKLIPSTWLPQTGFIVRKVMGKMSKRHQELFVSMLKGTSPKFIKWALGAILHWDNQTIPPNVYHIIGDKDKVFPYKRIKGATIIKGGTHIMIYTKAKEINNWLKDIIN